MQTLPEYLPVMQHGEGHSSQCLADHKWSLWLLDELSSSCHSSCIPASSVAHIHCDPRAAAYGNSVGGMRGGRCHGSCKNQSPPQKGGRYGCPELVALLTPVRTWCESGSARGRPKSPPLASTQTHLLYRYSQEGHCW